MERGRVLVVLFLLVPLVPVWRVLFVSVCRSDTGTSTIHFGLVAVFDPLSDGGGASGAIGAHVGGGGGGGMGMGVGALMRYGMGRGWGPN